jgi:hypothetical protein
MSLDGHGLEFGLRIQCHHHLAPIHANRLEDTLAIQHHGDFYTVLYNLQDNCLVQDNFLEQDEEYYRHAGRSGLHCP